MINKNQLKYLKRIIINKSGMWAILTKLDKDLGSVSSMVQLLDGNECQSVIDDESRMFMPDEVIITRPALARCLIKAKTLRLVWSTYERKTGLLEGAMVTEVNFVVDSEHLLTDRKVTSGNMTVMGFTNIFN